MDNQNDKDDKKSPAKKRSGFLKFLLVFVCILVFICLVWLAFSLIGRVNAVSVIPDTAYQKAASLRISVANPMRLLDNILTHESFDDIADIPALAQAAPILKSLKGNSLLKNFFVRFATQGNFEFALYSSEARAIIAAWDMKLCSPLLRILPLVSNFVNVPNLFYFQAGKNSRFEYRLGDMTLYIGPYRNLLFITDDAQLFESRSKQLKQDAENSGTIFKTIKPSAHDAALVLSNSFISGMLADQDQGIASLLDAVEFDSIVEAGISVYPKKIEFRLSTPLTSNQQSLSRILTQRSRVPVIAELIPADSQYATVLSAGTLNELYQAALIFSPELGDALKTAEGASRFLLGLTLNDLLFSWTGNEFAVFGLEGRPHPVYAINIADERKRQEVFNKAFRSIVLNENVRLNLDGVRIPQIELPAFLQMLLRNWNIFIPSPYYIIHKDFLLASESAEALLATLRAMQKNDVLPRTAAWREIAGGKTVASTVSLFYSLDVSIPFFLRKSTVLSSFLSLYKQGLIRISFDRGVVDFSLSLVPGSGNGVTLMNGFPISAGDRPSNRVYGAGFSEGNGENARIFYSSGGTAYSLKVADNSKNELPNQGTHWILPADNTQAWVVTDRGRVTLVDINMETVTGFPILLGLRLSAAPVVFDNKLYLCDEDRKVYMVDTQGKHSVWETSFDAALRSSPNFLTVTSRRTSTVYTAVYPKSFFGEIYLLDVNGKTLPNWPAPIAVDDNDGKGSDFGIGFGSPLLFAHNNRVLVAFINQSGQLLVYDENAAFVSPFPINLDGVFYQQPVFDGLYLWLVSSEGNFFRVALDGDVLYQQIPGFRVMEEGYITIFDSDNNKEGEVYITGDGNALHAYTRHFRSLEGFPLPVWGKPLFVSAQGNRKAEIFGIGMDRKIYRWQFR